MSARFAAAAVALAAMPTRAEAFAAAGDLHATFANAGRIAARAPSFGGDNALQADGKSIATSYYSFKIARFRPKGFLDASA